MLDEITDQELSEQLVALDEGALRRDGTVRVKVIQSGWGASGYYSPDVLKRDGPAVFKAGTRMFWDHPSRTQEADHPERSIRDLAAVLASDARWEEDGKHGAGLYADAKVFSPFKESLTELAPHIGVSIRAFAKVREGEAEGRKGRVVENIATARSIDFVTAPGAGGKVIELFEAARAEPGTELPASATTPTQETAMTQESGGAEFAALQESVTKLTTRLDEVETSNKQLLETNRTQATELARLREADIIREAQSVAVATLRPINLPDMAKARIAESLAMNPPLTAEKTFDKDAFVKAVQEEAKREGEYLARVHPGAGRVTGMGGEPITEAKPEDIQAALKEAASVLGLSESAAATFAAGRGS